MHRYENQTKFETIHVYGANYVYAMNESTERPVPIKQPSLAVIDPLGIGRLCVLIILWSLFASTT
jgi:hypothetical protein